MRRGVAPRAGCLNLPRRWWLRRLSACATACSIGSWTQPGPAFRPARDCCHQSRGLCGACPPFEQRSSGRPETPYRDGPAPLSVRIGLHRQARAWCRRRCPPDRCECPECPRAACSDKRLAPSPLPGRWVQAPEPAAPAAAGLHRSASAASRAARGGRREAGRTSRSRIRSQQPAADTASVRSFAPQAEAVVAASWSRISHQLQLMRDDDDSPTVSQAGAARTARICDDTRPSTSSALRKRDPPRDTLPSPSRSCQAR